MSGSYPASNSAVFKHAAISSGILISNILSGKPNCAFASPFSEQSGISLAVRNTLAPVPPPTVPATGS